MATEREKIFKKYGVGTTSDKGKQNYSASPTRTNESSKATPKTEREKIYEKYGVGGTTKQTDNKPKALFADSTPSTTKKVDSPNTNTKKYIDYNTESKTAYDKYKSNPTTTIPSNLTEDERKARIKEIDSELMQLSKVRNGLSRAGLYGNVDDMIAKNESRQAELAKEKRELERVGTFTSSEMLQQDIDDAKRDVSRLQQEVSAYGQRPSADVAEEWGKTNSELFNAKNKLAELERQKSLYDNIDKFGDVVNKDSFIGQWKANYRSKELSEDSAKAFSAYMDNPTDENLELALAYDAFVKEYMKNNEKALDDEGQVLPLLSDNFASYLAQQKGSLGTAVPLGIAGGAFGLLGGGAGVKAGWTLGYSAGSSINSYNVIRGSLFSELLSYGLDEESARQLANDDAIIESLIESGETAKDWAYMLFTGGKNIVGKGAKAVTSKATNKLASAMAKASAHPLLNLGGKIAKGTVLNAGTEYLEEGMQGATSRATREKSWAIIDSEIGQYGEGNIDLHNRPIYKNADGTISTVDSVTFTVDGKYVVLPTIVRDENGNAKRLTTDEEIFAHYEKTGEYLGEFDTLEQANIYANRLHSAQAYRYSENISTDADDSALVGG